MEKTKYVGGRKRRERDYSKPLSELLPQIIGRRSKTVGEIADEAGRAEQPHGVYTKTLSIHNLAFPQNNPFPFCSPFLKE